MRVFNLTDQRLDYKGRTIAPYGSEEYDLTFIPDRDRALEKAKILAFGALPKGWRKPQPPPEVVKVPVAVQQVPVKAVEKPAPLPMAAVEEVKVEEKTEFFKKNKR